jgi:hypothetical protein
MQRQAQLRVLKGKIVPNQITQIQNQRVINPSLASRNPKSHFEELPLAATANHCRGGWRDMTIQSSILHSRIASRRALLVVTRTHIAAQFNAFCGAFYYDAT